MLGSWDAYSSDDDVAAVVRAPAAPSQPERGASASARLVAQLRPPVSVDSLEELIHEQAVVAQPLRRSAIDFSKLAVAGLGTRALQVVSKACASDAKPEDSALFTLAEKFVGSGSQWSVPGRAVMASMLGHASRR
jgi:hypothetical protein